MDSGFAEKRLVKIIPPPLKSQQVVVVVRWRPRSV